MAIIRPDVAIVGAGPAGCALACFLRQRGLEVIVYDNGNRPDLLVGESLIPAAIPIVQRLGIETEVARVSALKPGASLSHANGMRVDFVFSELPGKAPGYAYNVPRPEFDRIVRNRAEALGVNIVPQRAVLVPGTESSNDKREISLSRTSLEAAGLTQEQHPKLLVDATGRTRLFARQLDIASRRGERNDTAYFAHYKDFDHSEVEPGQVLITILSKGWSWRIPLKDALSVGVVMDKQSALKYGETAQERLDAMIQDEPILASRAKLASRITPVRSYSNYQLISQRGYGKGWVMVGDAYGFVDPMLSPGVFMALESASLLDKNIHARQGRVSALTLDKYCRSLDQWHHAWKEVIEYMYDGSLLRLHEAGKNITENSGKYSRGRFYNWYYRRIIGELVSGVGTRSAFKRRVLKEGVKRLIDPEVGIDRHAILDRYPDSPSAL